MSEENPNFLKGKYDLLHNSEEVESAKNRTNAGVSFRSNADPESTEKKVSENPADKIQNYLNRFTEILDRKDPAKRERGIEAIKQNLHENFVINPEEVPESTFLLEQRIAREQGHGTIEITEEFKQEKTDQIIANQTRSLDKWIDYLTSPDAPYPDWAKYWSIRSVLAMGKLEKEETEEGTETARYGKRTKNTVSSFPTVNPRALAKTISTLRSKLEEDKKPKRERGLVANESSKLSADAFQKLATTEDFSKIYTQFLIEIPEYSAEGLKETRGEWVTFPQGSDATELAKSLEGHPLEWCIADFDTAQGYLKGGDMYLYYSYNESGDPIIPRTTIRMENGHIAEVRGIAPGQNLDPYIGDVTEAKLKEFGAEGEAYKKKSADMKYLTAIEEKTKNGEELTKQDLEFLYEQNSSIEGFGYEKDPRIADLLDQRNPQEDMLVLLECVPEQIARNIGDINENTKVYVGKLGPGIFEKCIEYGIDRVYTSFPKEKVHFEPLEIGGQTAEELLSDLRKGGVDFHQRKGSFASRDLSVLNNPEESILDLNTLDRAEDVLLIRLRVKDLGFSKEQWSEDVYKRAQSLGLSMCPAEVVPRYALSYKEQLFHAIPYFAMDKIKGPGRKAGVLSIRKGFDKLQIDGGSVEARWGIHDEVVFTLEYNLAKAP